jgi:hypothetical protein
VVAQCDAVIICFICVGELGFFDDFVLLALIRQPMDPLPPTLFSETSWLFAFALQEFDNTDLLIRFCGCKMLSHPSNHPKKKPTRNVKSPLARLQNI